jgi:hypothetical protein
VVVLTGLLDRPDRRSPERGEAEDGVEPLQHPDPTRHRLVTHLEGRKLPVGSIAKLRGVLPNTD